MTVVSTSRAPCSLDSYDALGCAQIRAADAAEKAATWALISLLTSIGGLIGLYFTFRETRATAKQAAEANRLTALASKDASLQAKNAEIATQRSLEYTQSSLEISKDTLQSGRKAQLLELRPYVILMGPTWYPSRDFNDDDGRIHADAMMFGTKWTNAGRTPAMECTQLTHIMTIPFQDNPADWSFDGQQWPASTVVGPQTAILTPERGIFGQELQDVLARRRKVIIYVESKYKSLIADQVFNTKVCLSCRFNGVAVDFDRTPRPNFEVVAEGPFNGAT